MIWTPPVLAVVQGRKIGVVLGCCVMKPVLVPSLRGWSHSFFINRVIFATVSLILPIVTIEVIIYSIT